MKSDCMDGLHLNKCVWSLLWIDFHPLDDDGLLDYHQ